MKDWLTPKEVGEQCGVSKSTVVRWIKSDKLIAIQLPSGHYRIKPESYKNFLEKYRMQIKDKPSLLDTI